LNKFTSNNKSIVVLIYQVNNRTGVLIKLQNIPKADKMLLYICYRIKVTTLTY